MTFDERIRDSLASAAGGHDPGPPPTQALAANVGRRQRTKLAVSGLAAMATVMLIVGLAALPGVSTPKETVRVDQPATGVGEGEGTEGSVVPEPTTTTLTVPPDIGNTGPPTSVIASPPSYIPPTSAYGVTTFPPHPGGPTTTALSTIPPYSEVRVTEADNGKTFTIRRLNTTLVVELNDQASLWSDPESDNATVLERSWVNAASPRSRVTAGFSPKAVGQAHVTSARDPACRNEVPACGQPTQLWQITVNVI